jgi:uncharacterized membrane protein
VTWRRLLDRLRAVESPSVVPAGLSRPSVEAVVYAVTAVLLLVGPATTAAGATWIVLDRLGTPPAVVAGGLSATAYGLFLVGLLDRAGYLSPDA